MALTQIISPLPQFTGLDGNALDAGYIYIGAANQNPETNPISVYWDKEGIYPALQPLRVMGGYIYRGGTPSPVYVGSDYSISVKDKNKKLIYSRNDSYDTVSILSEFKNNLSSNDGANLVGWVKSSSYAKDRNVSEKISEWISVLDFGADSTGTIECSNNIQLAINSINNNGGLFVPAGTYLIDSTIVISKNNVVIFSDGNAILKKIGSIHFDAILITGNNNTIKDIDIDGNSVGWSGIVINGSYNTLLNVESYNNGGHGILLDGLSSVCAYNLVQNCNSHNNGEVGIAQNTALASRIENNICQNNNLEGITIDNPSYRSIVSGNQVINNCLTGGVGGIGIDRAYLSIISNNVVNNTQSSLSGLTFQCNVGDTTYCSIIGNVFSDNTGGGISLKKTGSYYSGFNIIDGNIFLNNSGHSVVIDNGCINNVLGENQYNGIWPEDSALNNRKSAGMIYFRVANNTLRNNVTGDGTLYTVPFEVVQMDNYSCYNLTNGKFTAPMKGFYQFEGAVRVINGSGSENYSNINFIRSGSASYTATLGNQYPSSVLTFPTFGSSTFFLESGDTVECAVSVGGGVKVLDVADSINECYFSGYLIG